MTKHIARLVAGFAVVVVAAFIGIGMAKLSPDAFLWVFGVSLVLVLSYGAGVLLSGLWED